MPDQTKSAAELRRERQAAALRENPRKRKQQARDRKDGAEREPERNGDDHS